MGGFIMLKKALFATALVVATVAIPALTPQKADAQIFVRGRGFGVAVGTPYYGGYGGYGGYYGYRPYYYSTPYYGSYYNGGYYNYGYPRYYGGRYW
jgi:hypothetical protein